MITLRTKHLLPMLGAAALLAMLPGCATKKAVPDAAPKAAEVVALPPVDARANVPPERFDIRSTPGEFLHVVQKAPFAFDEMIYSWDVKLPEGEGFRLFFQVGFPDGSQSPWLYGGYWGTVTDTVTERKEPTFEFGKVAMDQLLLTKKADRWQFKVVSAGTTPLTVVPRLRVITTDNNPPEGLAEKHAKPLPPVPQGTIVYDLPLRKQENSKGEHTPDRCQSAAVATAMEAFGKPLPLEDIIALTNDPEYDYPGIWPRTIAAATQNGFTGTIDRFRTWDQVRVALGDQKVILVSMTMPAGGDYKAPPYPKMGGHIIALNGVTEDGRVVVTDSALGKDGTGYLCQWLAEDFEKVWMTRKGGVGMVISPPAGVVLPRVKDLPPFPWEARKAGKVQ